MRAAVRAFILLAGLQVFVDVAVADECRSCEFSRGVPPELWQEFSASLDALNRFTLADEALGRRLAEITGRNPDSAHSAISDSALLRFMYPWKPELLQGRLADQGLQKGDAGPEALNDTPGGPIWLSVPHNESRMLTVSANEVRHEPAVANLSRTSGKWYWEVRYRAGTANLPHAALVGVVDVARADLRHNPAEEMAALPPPSFAALLGGEYIQFALDLDRHTLHYGVNGNWNSDPANTAFGIPIAGRTAFAPAALPEKPARHPYSPDELEFNFGASRFRYPIPVGYRPYDLSEPAKATSARSQPDPANTHGRHELAFLAATRNFEQSFDPTTERRLQEALTSWRAYRDAACHLSARFAKTRSDPNCIREMGGALLSVLPRLEYLSRLSADPPFDELPPIDLERHPILHYVDASHVAKDAAHFDDHRLTVAVHVTDKSGPLILFLRGFGGTHWRITVDQGVNVQHVFLFGQYEQTATVSGRVPSLRSYSNEQDNSGKLWKVLYQGDRSSASLEVALESLIGVPPTSIQQGCENARCEIGAKPLEIASGNPK
jgi:hypothetical protein